MQCSLQYLLVLSGLYFTLEVTQLNKTVQLEMHTSCDASQCTVHLATHSTADFNRSSHLAIHIQTNTCQLELIYLDCTDYQQPAGAVSEL